MSTDSTLRIGLILPDVLGTYGDDGNALVLRQRARARNIDAEIVPIRLGEAVPDSLDIYAIGGGEDVAQSIAAEHLLADGGLARAAASRRPILAICAGFQILGESFRAGGKEIDGLGLVDCRTDSLATRAIGEICTVPFGDVVKQPLTGFENHMGRTVLGKDARPLGTVVRGVGNEGPEVQPGEDITKLKAAGGAEGAVQDSIICTYLHGPVLARNPELADVLLARAMGVELTELAAIDLPEFAVVDKLRDERIHSKPRPKSER